MGEKGLHFDQGGFVLLGQLFRKYEGKLRWNRWTLKTILFCAQFGNKWRFVVSYDPQGYAHGVKCLEGQNAQAINKEIVYQTVVEYKYAKPAFHGTNVVNFASIIESGENRPSARGVIMMTEELPSSGRATSGSRSSSPLFLQVDVGKAILNGIGFRYSSTGSVVCFESIPVKFLIDCHQNGDRRAVIWDCQLHLKKSLSLIHI